MSDPARRLVVDACPSCGFPLSTVRDERPCACGCPEFARGESAYASDACRTRHWKQRTQYRADASENAGNGTLRVRPGGRQASFGPAVRVLTAFLIDTHSYEPARAERVARNVLTLALPRRQRRPRTQLREAA